MSKDKRKALIDYFEQKLKNVDPSGENIKRYTSFINSATDMELKKFITDIKEGRVQISFMIPNMVKRLSMEKMLSTAENINLKIFDYIWYVDKESNEMYRSNYKYPIYKIPLRRMQQYLDKKLSVPGNDKKIDLLTGQVTGDDRSAAITNPEIQALTSRGLSKTLHEMVSVRGGNISAYGEFKRQLEENGECRLVDLVDDSVARSAVVTKVLFQSMHIDSNIVED